MLVAEVVDPPPELDPPEVLEPPVEAPVPVEFAEVGGVEDVALASADELELPWPQAARDTIRRRVGIALIVLIALGIRIMVARSGNSIFGLRRGLRSRAKETISLGNDVSSPHKAHCRQPRYLNLLIDQTGGFASPPRGGFAL